MIETPGVQEGEAPPPTPPSYWPARLAGVGVSTARSLLLPTLALVTALLIGGIIIAFTDLNALRRLGTEPGAALGEMLRGVGIAYKSLLVGSVGSLKALSETLFAATPLIFAGLGVALGFRSGLFNIGAQGQVLIGAMAALWVGMYVAIPAIAHIPLALLAGVIGGMFWAGIPGILKARTGAHEVITTIMLNFIALYLVQWLLTIPTFQEPGRNNPQSGPILPSAQLPPLMGSSFRVTIAFALAVAAVLLVRWLIFRSSLGFEFRALGLNQQAGRYAGMNVKWLITLAMALAGGLVGLAGASQILGLAPYKATPSLAGSVGFDAITVALLGRSHPVGVLWAALLFGALKAGGREMQGAAQIPLDLVVVLQALIVMFVAAPELVRAIYRVRVRTAKTEQLRGGWGS